MKELKINSMKTLFNLLFIIFLLPACSSQSNKAAGDTRVEKPTIDLQSAVISGNLEAVKQHIAAGSDINRKDPMSNSTPLISAATFGKTEVAKLLIEAGADLALTNNDGATALHAAAFFCQVEIVQLLIDAKANKQLRNNYGATPRESVIGPFADIKPIYEMLQQQLAPLGLQLDLSELEKKRPVVAMMLK